MSQTPLAQEEVGPRRQWWRVGAVSGKRSTELRRNLMERTQPDPPSWSRKMSLTTAQLNKLYGVNTQFQSSNSSLQKASLKPFLENSE